MQPHITAAHALAYHVLAPGLLAHHKHGLSASNLWAVAHGSQGQGPRVLVLLIASVITGVILAAVTSRKSDAPR